MQNQALIDIKNLVWGYAENPHLTFTNFNFSLNKGEFCVVMGKSGTGKSTLAKLLMGQKKVPAGMIFHKGQDIGNFTDYEMQVYRRKVGMVFQHDMLIDYLPVKENVIYPLSLYRLGETVISNKYAKMKQRMQLQNIEHTPVHFLSAGQKQKVALARAIIHDPEYIIADEPTGNLDRESTQDIANLLIESNILGMTVLLITHDIHLVNFLKEHHTPRIVMM